MTPLYYIIFFSRVPEVIAKVKHLIDTDSTITLKKISQITNLAHGTLHKIVKNDLGYKKIRGIPIKDIPDRWVAPNGKKSLEDIVAGIY